MTARSMLDTQTCETFKYECLLQQKHHRRWAEEQKQRVEKKRLETGEPVRPPTQGTGLLSVGLTVGSAGFKTLPSGFVTPRARTSAALRFLDQKTGIAKSPCDAMHEATDMDILCFGVSKEGLGRSAYLKSRRRLPPQERFQESLTSAQDIGWLAAEPSPRGSSFARKPVMKSTFFRPSGVLNNRDLLPAAHLNTI